MKRKPLFTCVRFVLEYEDILNCKIIRNNQRPIFPSLCLCLIDGKANCRSNYLCMIFLYVEHIFGTMLHEYT